MTPLPDDVPGQAKRTVLAGTGWVLIALAPPVGLATPMIPIGFVVLGAGLGLVVRNSPRGRRVIRRGAAWTARRYPKAYTRMPKGFRRMLGGAPRTSSRI